jgi:hypothetical protein
MTEVKKRGSDEPDECDCMVEKCNINTQNRMYENRVTVNMS